MRMAVAGTAPRSTPKAARTRLAILEAAEGLFAARGFAATRLEDVADRVGIKRASIVYHFRDKRELYDAVLAGVFEGLRDRLESVLLAEGPALRCIEDAVAAWIDYLGERPTFARLLLREAAGVTPRSRGALLDFVEPLDALVRRFVAAHRGRDLPDLPGLVPAHMASAVAGSSIFFVAALPALLRDASFDPLAPEQLAALRREVLRIARQFIGAADTTEEDAGGNP